MNKRVALIVESSRGYGRDLLAGIGDYGRVHGPWSFFTQERRLEDPLPSWLESWRGDGAIVRCDSQSMLIALQSLRLPCVDLRGNFPSPWPVVRCDDRLAVRCAVNHLIDRGLTRLAFCGYETVSYSHRRLEEFTLYMAELGLTFATYQSPPPFKQATTVDIEQANVLFESALANWLRALAKPVGIVAANDIRGQQLLATCRTIDMLVPEQIAVVGIDNDLTLCELSDPPMSSVELDAHQIGLQAAEILDEMMSGREYSGKSASIPPKGVIKRQSTDAIVVEDPQVAIALRYIRLHASMGLSVEDVASQVPLSRRTLERRIRESLDCSINELIIRHQLEQAKKLLAETDWSLMVIASRSGFRHGEYLSTLFKREMGITPGEYRRKIKDKQAAPPDDGN